MSCSVTIQSVTGTAIPGASTVHVTVVASSCKTLQIIAKCALGTTSQIYALTGAASETVTKDLNVRCPCGADVLITANCVDPQTLQPIPGCTSDTYQGLIVCGDDCCIPPVITYDAGACDASNHRVVTFTTTWNVPATLPSSCFPLVGQLHFGDANSVGLLQYISAPGPYTFSDTYSYPAAATTTYQAQFVYTHPSCPPVTLPVTVSSCAPPNCCPKIANVLIEPGPCQANCTRAVNITTAFSAPAAGCLAEALQWHFFASNGSPITNVSSNAFLTTGTSPNVQTFIFDPALSPITAKLTGLQYPNCPDIVRTIDITPCDSPPACPVIHSFTANVMGCENVNGTCLRRVEFTVDADIAAGCGASAGTRIEIDFGDGDQTQLQYSASGHYTTTASHHFSGGDYQATLDIINPSQCLGTLISVHVPDCSPADCNIDAPCPPVPDPPPLCLCKFCYIFSQKAGKHFCKAILVLVALYVSLVIVGVFMGVTFNFNNIWTWTNLLAAISAIGMIPAVVWYPHKCSYCCAACALLLGIILGIIAVIILLIYGYLQIMIAGLLNPAFVRGVILLVVLFATWLFFNAWCKDYADNHLTSDNWCKDE